MRNIDRIKKQLRERLDTTEVADREELKFFEDILNLIDEMEKESAASYYEGQAAGMETMATIIFGSKED